MSLAQALTMMLDGAEMGNIDKNLSKEEVENYLKRADKEKKIFSFARKLCAKASSLRMKIWQATGATVIAKVALENTERTWLKIQRRQLKIKGADLSRPHTPAEIDLYKSRHPKLGIEFVHFPQDSREVCKRKRDNE